MNDSELLRRFADQADQSAFAVLVQNHLPLVYGAAVRHAAGDTHQAEDIAQQVFVDLARKSRQLIAHPCLAGWLYASTRREAFQAIRTAQRRLHRETQAVLMNDNSQDPQWEKIRPVLDDALADLDERERHGVLLRFFSNQDFKAIGEQLGLTDNAAQKLVARALERLNAALGRRGVSSTSSALSVVLGSAAATPPATLASSIMATAPAAALVAKTATLSSVLLKAALVTGVAAAGFGAGLLYQSRPALPPLLAPAVPVVTAPSPDLLRLQQQVQQANRRADLAEEDNARLLEAVQRFKTSAVPAVAVTPPPAPVTPPPVAEGVHVTLPGDTAAKIAQANGLTVDELVALNPDVNWRRLKVGQTIQVH
jgi:RNA polymerase sigma factor (sigma-70 family)